MAKTRNTDADKAPRPIDVCMHYPLEVDCLCCENADLREKSVHRRGACKEVEGEFEGRTPDRARGLDAGVDPDEYQLRRLRRHLHSCVGRDAESAIGIEPVAASMGMSGRESAAKNHKRNTQQADEELPSRTHM